MILLKERGAGRHRKKRRPGIRRKTHRLVPVLTLLVTACSAAVAPVAGDAHDAPGVHRELLNRLPLPDLPGYMMTALTVELAPGVEVGPHRHGGFVYVYLLEGRIVSQMDGEEPVEYVAGESWTEPAHALHRQTVNPSKTESSKFLAIIYSEEKAVITQPEMRGH